MAQLVTVSLHAAAGGQKVGGTHWHGCGVVVVPPWVVVVLVVLVVVVPPGHSGLDGNGTVGGNVGNDDPHPELTGGGCVVLVGVRVVVVVLVVVVLVVLVVVQPLATNTHVFVPVLYDQRQVPEQGAGVVVVPTELPPAGQNAPAGPS